MSSLRDAITNENVATVYDDAIRTSTSNPDVARACGRTRIEFERMMRNGHFGRVRKAIEDGRQDWAPYLYTEIEKDGGGTRPIEAPAWDVALSLSLLRDHYGNELPIPDEFFGQSSEYTESDTGVHAAVQQARHAVPGRWTLRIDIENFYGAIPHDVVRRVLATNFESADVDLAFQLLTLPAVDDGGNIVKDRQSSGIAAGTAESSPDGVPQGSQLSPLVGRLVLRSLPERLRSIDAECIVYVDDLLIWTADQSTARRAYVVTTEFLDERGLQIHESFDDAVRPPGESVEFLQQPIRFQDSDGDSPSDVQFPPVSTDGDSRVHRDDDPDHGQGPDGNPDGQRPGRRQWVTTNSGDPSQLRQAFPIHSGSEMTDRFQPGDCRQQVNAQCSAPLPEHSPSHHSIGLHQPSSPSLSQDTSRPYDTGARPTASRLSPSLHSALSTCQSPIHHRGSRLQALETGLADVARMGTANPRDERHRLASRGAGRDARSPKSARSEATFDFVSGEWLSAARSLAAMASLDGSLGWVQIDDAPEPDIEVMQRLNATVSGRYGMVHTPDADADQWNPDVFVVTIPRPPKAGVDEGRSARIRDVLDRVAKVLPPGGVLLATCGDSDLDAQIAFEDATCRGTARVTEDVLPVGHASVRHAIWQRRAPDVADWLGHLRMPWIRVARVHSYRYRVHLWTGESHSTDGHHLLASSHLPRPRSALHDIVADAIEDAPEGGASSLLVVHHGDFLPQFVTSDWNPQKPDLITPVRRLQAAVDRLDVAYFVREHRRDGIIWDSMCCAGSSRSG